MRRRLWLLRVFEFLLESATVALELHSWLVLEVFQDQSVADEALRTDEKPYPVLPSAPGRVFAHTYSDRH